MGMEGCCRRIKWEGDWETGIEGHVDSGSGKLFFKHRETTLKYY